MISYYELLGMIKEDKAPNKIRVHLTREPRIYEAEYYDDGDFSHYFIDGDTDEEYHHYLSECLLESNMFDKNIEIIEEDKFKTKVMVVDKEGNEKEYLLELGEGLKEGEKIFKANDGNWYAQKLIDEKSEFYKWLDEFEPTIYYSMEEDKKLEKMSEFYTEHINENGEMTEIFNKHELAIIDKINEIIDKLNEVSK